MKKLTIWIVGASSGIGLELVKLWLAQGHNVIARSRKATTSHELHLLQYAHTHQLRLIDIDASDSSSLESIIDQAWESFGGIDRWFYNA
jgi:short-subunit dehydrogenase